MSDDDTRPSFEQAKDCPKCGKPGEVRRVTASRDGTGRPVELHLVYCTTELCKWFDSPWVVQVNSDGSIPKAYSQIGEKKYPRISQESMTKIEDNVKRQLEAEQRKNSEINNPHG